MLVLLWFFNIMYNTISYYGFVLVKTTNVFVYDDSVRQYCFSYTIIFSTYVSQIMKLFLS
jgi:hypothetical protein